MLPLVKRFSAHLTVLFDILLIPACFLCHFLSEHMLIGGKPCTWTAFGAKCATCGGTRCVNSFLEGRFTDAFAYNPAVFIGILYVILTVVMLNLLFVFRKKFAKPILLKMYSLTAFFVVMGMLLVFTVVRNIPWIISLVL